MVNNTHTHTNSTTCSGILAMSWYANASGNITDDSKQIMTVTWTPAAPGAPSQVPPTQTLRNPYANPTHREGFWLGVFLGLWNYILHKIMMILCLSFVH